MLLSRAWPTSPESGCFPSKAVAVPLPGLHRNVSFLDGDLIGESPHGVKTARAGVGGRWRLFSFDHGQSCISGLFKNQSGDVFGRRVAVHLKYALTTLSQEGQ